MFVQYHLQPANRLGLARFCEHEPGCAGWLPFLVVDCLGRVCGFPVRRCLLHWSAFHRDTNTFTNAYIHPGSHTHPTGDLHANLYGDDHEHADRDLYTYFHANQYCNRNIHVYVHTDIYTYLHSDEHTFVNSNFSASRDYGECGL